MTDRILDKESFEKPIWATEPEEGHEWNVEDILRDRDYGWKLDYYHEKDTSWDVSVSRMQMKIRKCQDDIESNKKILAKLDSDAEKQEQAEQQDLANRKARAEQLEKAKKESDAAKKEGDAAKKVVIPEIPYFKKITPTERKRLDQVYAVAKDAINDDTKTMETSENLLKDYLWYQHVEKCKTATLRRIRNKFRNDGDLDFMRRGVTWVNNYSSKLFGEFKDPPASE